MAQRAVKFSTKTAPPPSARPVRLAALSETSASGVPLSLSPLIAPYRGQGRLALRLERLPQRARLSNGRNNGDSSWSLATDELEDLFYLPPEGAAGVHMLSMRVLDIDSASTLALIDLPVMLGDAIGISGRSAQAELDRIGGEIERVRTVLSGHTSSLAATLSRPSQPAVDTALEFRQAQKAWDAERERLIGERDVAVEAALSHARDAWQAETDVRLHQREELARHELANARERWQAESEASLGRAERAWKADESTRLAELERRLRSEAKSRAAAVDVRARDAEESGRKDGEELARLRAELSTTMSALAERESALAQARLRARQERESLRRETALALEDARKALIAEGTRELEQARAIWAEESARAVAKADAARVRAEAALAAARDETGTHSQIESEAIAAKECAELELASLRDSFAASQNATADAQAQIARMKLQSEEARAQAHHANAESLARARETWAAEEAARIAAEKAGWQKQQERLLEVARGENAIAREQAGALLDEARERLGLIEAHLAERELELQQSRDDAQAELAALQAHSAAQLERAERAWKTAEAARASAARAQWREQSIGALTEATQRYQAAEAALAAQRARAEAGMRRGEPADLERLRQEVLLLQSALGTCEAELGELRTVLAGADNVNDNDFVLQPLQVDRFVSRLDDESPPTRKLWREALAIAALVALAIFAYPFVESVLPDGWRREIAALDPLPSPMQIRHTSPAPVRQVIRAPAVQKYVLVTAATNLRVAPSAHAGIVQTLPPDAKLIDLASDGSWTHVRTLGMNGKSLDGWVHRSRLRQQPLPVAPSSLRS